MRDQFTAPRLGRECGMGLPNEAWQCRPLPRLLVTRHSCWSGNALFPFNPGKSSASLATQRRNLGQHRYGAHRISIKLSTLSYENTRAQGSIKLTAPAESTS